MLGLWSYVSRMPCVLPVQLNGVEFYLNTANRVAGVPGLPCAYGTVADWEVHGDCGGQPEGAFDHCEASK